MLSDHTKADLQRMHAETAAKPQTREAEIVDTTVHSDYQRLGIGKKLVTRAVEVAANSGVEGLHVDYERALESFYAACGFRPTSAGLIQLAGHRR